MSGHARDIARGAAARAARTGAARTVMARGYTLIEALLVVAMIVIISAAASPMLSNALSRKDVTNYVAEAIDAVREAQTAAMTGRNNVRYGVHFQGSSFTFYQGASVATDPTTNVVHTMPSLVTITAVSLSSGSCTLPAGTGAGCDIHFASRRGTPTETGSVTFAESGGLSKVVTINAAGMIDYN